MHSSHRAFLFTMATLGGLVVYGPSTRGASVGIHGYQNHQSQQSSILPPLHETVPAHVPQFSNPGLVKFWMKHEFSPILRDPGIQMQLCTAVTQARDLNPVRFDKSHALLGHLLRDPGFLKTALDAYMSHPARFVHYHHHLIPLLRGCALMMANQQNPPAVSPELITAPGSATVNPVPEEINNGPGPNPPSSPEEGPISVPAPPSIVLMTMGLGYLARRLRSRRPLTPRGT
jgi:hypothetical protein